MNLVKKGEVWVVGSRYEEREEVKALGFWWHSGGRNCAPKCAACRWGVGQSWWTPAKSVAEKLASAADEGTRPELEREIERRDLSLAASTEKASSLDIPTKLPLLGFQKAGIAFIELHEGRALVADDLGVGKTAQAIGWLIRHPGALPALCVVPAGLRALWVREIAKFSDLGAHVVAGPSMWRGFERLGIMTFDSSCVPVLPKEVSVMGYETFVRLEKRHGALDHYRTVIFDEAQALKEKDAQRTQAAMAFSRHVENVLLLSGTPLMNRPKELWTLTQLVKPSLFPNFWSYAHKFCAAKQVEIRGRKVWDVDGASNLQELDRVLREELMIRRSKKDVLPDLPEKRRVTIPVIASGTYRREAKEALAELREAALSRRAWKADQNELLGEAKPRELALHAEKASKEARIRTSDPGSEGKRWDPMRAISALQRVFRAVALAKVPEAVSLVRSIVESGEKVVVFGHRHEILDLLRLRFAEEKILTAKIDGRDDPGRREAALAEFRTGTANVLILGILAAGVGLTITESSNVVVVELPMRPSDLDQAEARLWRLGQKSAVTSWILVLAGSVDEAVARMLDAKREVVFAATGDSARVLEEDGVLDAILNEVV